MADFLGVIADMRDGRVASQLSAFLTDLIARVTQTEQPGELTLKLKVLPGDSDGHSMLIELRPSCTTKMPQPTLAHSQMFATHDGRVSRNDPAQMEMELVTEDEKART